jgi:hypothetical protein
MQSDQHVRQRSDLAASSTREREEQMDTGRVCLHCGGTHRLMEICPDAPGAIELLRQYSHGDRTPVHVLAVGGIVTLAVVWTVALITAFSA